MELDSRSIRTDSLEKDNIYIASVEKFMISLTFSLSFVGKTPAEMLLGITLLILLGITLLILLGIRDNYAQN